MLFLLIKILKKFKLFLFPTFIFPMSWNYKLKIIPELFQFFTRIFFFEICRKENKYPKVPSWRLTLIFIGEIESGRVDRLLQRWIIGCDLINAMDSCINCTSQSIILACSKNILFNYWRWSRHQLRLRHLPPLGSARAHIGRPSLRWLEMDGMESMWNDDKETKNKQWKEKAN